MGNRVIEAKRLKARRMRRAYLASPKHHANTTLIREFHGSAKGLSDFKRWFFGLTHIPDDVTLQSQNARRAELGLPSGLKRSSREEVLQRLTLFVEEPLKHSVVLIDMPDIKLMLFWSVGVQAQWWFIRYDFMRQEFSKSKKYWTREKAMRALRLDRIMWVGAEKIPTG